ncbi:MAG: spore maturation protein A [Eubacteriales bacterium]|nr:spore maturation protein A [Eubacteriales bacterium]
MIGVIFGILCLISLFVGTITGNAPALGNAVLDGAAGAVELTVSLCGIMCLWGGVMQVLSDVGAIGKLSRLMSPFLRIFFPTAWRTGVGAEDIAANLSANLLGVGNAATPLALRAMSAMQSVNPVPGTATADMITLAVLNTASVSLVPSTVVALRRLAGAAEPYAVVVPVWICSVSGAALALICCRLAAGRRGQ